MDDVVPIESIPEALAGSHPWLTISKIRLLEERKQIDAVRGPDGRRWFSPRQVADALDAEWVKRVDVDVDVDRDPCPVIPIRRNDC